jgi:hypothetical protein
MPCLDVEENENMILYKNHVSLGPLDRHQYTTISFIHSLLHYPLIGLVKRHYSVPTAHFLDPLFHPRHLPTPI